MPTKLDNGLGGVSRRRQVVAGALGGLVFACLAFFPVSARAVGPPMPIGNGDQPNVAIDGSGTAHIVWNSQDAKKLFYCRIARGASTCTAPQELPVALDG